MKLILLSLSLISSSLIATEKVTWNYKKSIKIELFI